MRWQPFPMIVVVFAAARAHAATITLPSTGKVGKVIDGDTVVVKAEDGEHTLRLLGVEAPEAHASAKLDADASLSKQDKETILALGKKSADFARQLCEGKACRIEYDKANAAKGHRDIYGRLLVYLWIKDKDDKSILVNGHVIAQGYARACTAYPFDKDYRDLFVRHQQDAREARRGLWAEGADIPWPKLSDAAVVGNKKSRKYHLPTCSSVERMSPDNRVQFDSADAAKAQGYEPCKVCKP